MLKRSLVSVVLIISALMILPSALASENLPTGLPVKGMVTLVDLGADRCIPCKMMAPILAELKQEYRGQAAIVFLDVWKDRSLAAKFRIRVIPTQIFYDRQGKEVRRHEGFLGKEEIESVLTELGAAKPPEKM